MSSTTSSPLWELFIIVIVPIGSAIAWWVRGYVEQKRTDRQKMEDDKKQRTLSIIELQISEFYWPLYLNLLRYKKYSERYQEFRDGNLSLSSHESEEITDNSLFNKDEYKDEYKVELRAHPALQSLKPNIHHHDNNFVNLPSPTTPATPTTTPNFTPPSYKFFGDTQSADTNINQQIFSRNGSDDTQLNNTGTGNVIHQDTELDIMKTFKTIGVSDELPSKKKIPFQPPFINDIKNVINSPHSSSQDRTVINIVSPLNTANLNKFDQMLQSYRIKMLERLYEIQRIYTTSTPKVQQDNTIVKLIMELDEYITYVTADSEYYEFSNKKVERKFPSSIYSLIYRRLVALQDKYNKLVYGADEKNGDDIRINMTDIDNQQIQIPSIMRTIRHRRGITM